MKKTLMDLSPEELMAAGCNGKEKFDTFSQAREVVNRRNSKKKREVYKCPFCRKFHVGGLNRKRGFHIRRSHELGR